MADTKKPVWPETIQTRDKKVANKVGLITQPGKMISLVVQIIRWTERGTVANKIQKLRR